MEPKLSWLIFSVAIGIAWWYYGYQKNSSRNRGRPVQRASNAASTKQPVQWSDTETKAKPSAKAAKAKAPRKSVKKAVQEAGDKAADYLSAASSAAGADADDDLSPITSPTTTAKAPSGKDVSDMLDSKAPVTVLKIGASEKPAPKPKAQPRSETPTETKKQRQNKRKQEEAKAAREEAEEKRKELLEQQRRTARISRGEPARNGAQAPQPPTGAWNQVAAPTPARPISGQLLDTLDNTSTASSSEAATNGTAPTPDSTSFSNLMSEEDQLREALAESAWTTVPKGKKKNKKTNGETLGEGSDSGLSHEPTPAPVKQAPVSAPAPIKKVETAKPASRFEVLAEPTTEASHPMDSDWPVV